MTQSNRGVSAPERMGWERAFAWISAIGMILAAPVFADSTFRMAFGSCAHQDKPQPVWDAIASYDPHVFAMIGDNIYGDTEDPDTLKAIYRKLSAKDTFSQFRNRSGMAFIGIWDDHDYGANDAGVEYPSKEASREIFCDFFEEPSESPRRTQKGGIYTSYIYGEEHSRVQVILLDTRWNRTRLPMVDATTFATDREPRSMGPYKAVDYPGAEFLGESQWAWLETQLREPAEIRVIASGIQILSQGTGWEAWNNFPLERQRLFDLLRKTQADGVLLISGDTHWAEFSKLDQVIRYPLWELTSSGLTEEWPRISPNRNRVGSALAIANFGTIEVDWAQPDPFITLSIRNVSGRIMLAQSFPLSRVRNPM